MMNREQAERAEAFAIAVHKSMMTMRFLVGVYGICPVCFCEAVIERLEDVRDDYDHNELVPPLTAEDLKEMISELELMSWKTEGTA